MSVGEAGVLETPSYICAAVFAVYLLVSLVLIKAIHGVQHKMSHWKRKGLRTAFDHVVLELMLLGFISLALLVFEKNITSICVPTHEYPTHWVLINHVKECHPCLEKTKTLSDHYKQEHECPFWNEGGENQGHFDGHEDHGGDEHFAFTTVGGHTTNATAVSSHNRRLMSSGGGHTCEEGKQPLVTSSVLHQIHLFIFLLGVTHVVTCAVMILLSSLKMSRFALATENDVHMQQAVQQVRNTIHFQPGQVFDHTFSSRSIDLEGAGDQSTNIDSEGPPSKWIAPERDMSKFYNVAIEYIISFFKQFICPVSVEEMNLMRASFMVTHQRTTNFHFLDYITAGLDDDFGQVVSINLLRGITVCLYILLLPPIKTRWETSFAVLLPVMLSLIIATKLVYIVRHVTRGGHVHKLDPGVFWFRKPRLLLPIVNITLFMTSLIFASLFFFTWQFGEFSCFFYGRSDREGLHGANWTWIAVLVTTVLVLLHLSFVTLPTYSLVVHMGATHWHKDLVPGEVQATFVHLAHNAKKRMKDHTSASTGKLNEFMPVTGSSIESSADM